MGALDAATQAHVDDVHAVPHRVFQGRGDVVAEGRTAIRHPARAEAGEDVVVVQLGRRGDAAEGVLHRALRQGGHAPGDGARHVGAVIVDQHVGGIPGHAAGVDLGRDVDLVHIAVAVPVLAPEEGMAAVDARVDDADLDALTGPLPAPLPAARAVQQRPHLISLDQPGADVHGRPVQPAGRHPLGAAAAGQFVRRMTVELDHQRVTRQEELAHHPRPRGDGGQGGLELLVPLLEVVDVGLDVAAAGVQLLARRRLGRLEPADAAGIAGGGRVDQLDDGVTGSSGRRARIPLGEVVTGDRPHRRDHVSGQRQHQEHSQQGRNTARPTFHGSSPPRDAWAAGSRRPPGAAGENLAVAVPGKIRGSRSSSSQPVPAGRREPRGGRSAPGGTVALCPPRSIGGPWATPGVLRRRHWPKEGAIEPPPGPNQATMPKFTLHAPAAFL